jgi:D-psicose/D-tagatose/L-ribulose 3-epimerase
MYKRQIGIHVSLWTPSWMDDVVEHIHTAAHLGFDAVELPIMDPQSFPLERCRTALQATGSTVHCGTGLNPSTDLSSLDSGIRAAGLAHLAQCLAIAHSLGSASLEGVVHSAWGRHSALSKQERQHMVDGLRQTADTAATLGMFVGLECVNRYESSVLNTVDQGLALLAEIQRDNVGLHLDTYHMNIEENSIPQALRTCASKLFFLHLSENQRGYPGSGHLPWEAIFATLKEIGYRGPLVIESYVTPACPAGEDVAIWREIEKDKHASLRASLAYMRQLADKG